MNFAPVRDMVEHELQQQLRRVMAGDEVVKYDVALEVAMRAARTAVNLAVNRARTMTDPALSAAAALLSTYEDWEEDHIDEACAIALQMSDRLQSMRSQEDEADDEARGEVPTGTEGESGESGKGDSEP